jgi:hypothetical protein
MARSMHVPSVHCNLPRAPDLYRRASLARLTRRHCVEQLARMLNPIRRTPGRRGIFH